MILQYAGHLVAHVPFALKPAGSLLLKTHSLTHVFLLTILKIGILLPLKYQQLLCSVLIQPEWLVTIFYNIFQYLFHETYINLRLVYEIGRMLI